MQQKNIVVIGGSHGIGFGIVQRCTAVGANVFAISRTEGKLVEIPSVSHLSLDVMSDTLSQQQWPETVDGLVYCPGSINLGPLRSFDTDIVRQDFELNVVGCIRCVQALLPALKRADNASMVFFSTIAVAQGLAMHTSVAAAKGALEALVRTWAAELAPKIRVNAVAPALTNTPLADRFLSTDAKRQAMAAMYPLGRHGEVDDIADAAMYLLSPQSSWVTGQILRVDGGMSSVRK